MQFISTVFLKFISLSKLIKNRYKIFQKNRKFSALAASVRDYSIGHTTGPKILFGPSFSIYEPCKVHDFILANALQIRGAKIIPCCMGRLQFGETSYLGGIWGGLKDGAVNLDEKQERDNYRFVAESDKQLWETWGGLLPINLDKYVPESRIEELLLVANNYNLDEYKEWKYSGLNVGKWAVDSLRNNAMVSDETIIQHYQVKLYHYLHHIIIMVDACEGVLNDIKPDIVFSSDSYYYPWAILEQLCDRYKIPFYNGYPSIRKNAVCYAKGEPAMALNISRVWENFKESHLGSQELDVLDDFFKTRTAGKYSPGLNTCDPKENSDDLESFNWGKIDREKPTALLTPNVCWDLVALNRDVQFENMFDWIAKTIQFFEKHPEWQLIIKPHPAEENRHIPVTKQTVVKFLQEQGTKIPENVIVLGAKTEITVYDLFPIVKVGLVYTTTVGIEMTTLGIPVITAGRSHYHSHGFTFDPPTKELYFDDLGKLLANQIESTERETWPVLAKKFLYLYMFVYPIDLGILQYDFVDADITIEDGAELLPGRHEGLDFICTKILNKESVF